MPDLLIAILLAAIAGLAIPAGAALAMVERIQPRWLELELRHGIIAFGGGALLAAVSLVLVPEGVARLSIPAALLAFLAGGAVFLLTDRWLARHRIAAAQTLAMLMDFVPEAIALGAALALDEPTVYLLAFLIALQNLPEGFNAYREALASGVGRLRILAMFLGLAALGPVAAIAGMLVFADWPALLSALMLFAAGGILYLSFQGIAPAAKLDRAWLPGFGAVVGFALGLAGHMATAG